jgi:hypothetical protein
MFRSTFSGPAPLIRLARALLATLAIGLVAAACDSEDSECTKNEDCQEITCPDGSKMQSCSEGQCLQGDDCEDAGDGGW